MNLGAPGPQRRRSPLRQVALVLAVALVAAAWGVVLRTEASIDQRQAVVEGVPVDLLLPPGAAGAPGVVAVHGFAGSGTLLRSWTTELAQAGFVVAVPELAGHASRSDPLGGQDVVDAEVEAALDALQDLEEVDPDRVGLLGHSMGAGSVLRVGAARADDVIAVVAVSPVEAEVSAGAPPNLLLLAGAYEPRFRRTAEELYERAGGPGGDLDDGTARDLVVVPSVEHVTVLFSRGAHEASVDWLAAASGHDAEQPGGPSLIWWWLAHLAGVVVLWRLAAPLLVDAHEIPAGSRPRPLLGMVVGSVAATLLLSAVGSLVDLASLGGMHVAPALALWFALAGVGWLLLGARPGPFDPRDPGWALVLLGVLVVGFGLLASRVWLPFWPAASRLPHLAVFALLLLPWTLAFAVSVRDRRGVRGLGWWAAVAVVTVATLTTLATVVPELGFVTVLLPLLLAVLALLQVLWAPLGRPWAGGLAGAVFLGWLLAVAFPLA